MKNYYTPVGGLGLSNLGQVSDQMATTETVGPYGLGRAGYAVWSALSLAGASFGAYHGYKRNNGSVGWAIGWFLLGGIAPVITIPVSIAQGFGKPRVSKNRRRRRKTSRRTSRRRR
jgi:hypothetical protein